MRTTRARALATVSVMAVSAAASVFIGASPASAAPFADCNPIGPNWCQTAILPATNGGQIKVEATWKKTVCRVYDRDNGVEVGSVAVPASPGFKWWRNKTISGLRGDYFATCHNPDGGPDGSLSHP